MGVIFKFLLTGLVVLVVWWIVKFRGRMSVLKAAVQAAKKVMDDEKAAPKSHKTGIPVTLAPCPKCGTYIAAGTACTCGQT